MKQIISTLLAVQLFVVFGLCGLVCCIPAKSEAKAKTEAKAGTEAEDSHAHHIQTSQPAEESAHCHAKAAKKAAAAELQKQVVKTVPHCHGGNSSGRSVASATRICQCDANKQENPAFSVGKSDSSQQKGGMTALPFWQDVDQLPPAPSASPPSKNFKSPPFSGFQLSLRI